MKKSIISLGILSAIIISTTAAMAYSTVYTDEIGRHHFLGKDPGSKAAQSQYADLNNSKTKEFNSVNFKDQELNKEYTPSDKFKKSLFNKNEETNANTDNTKPIAEKSAPAKYDYKDKTPFSFDRTRYDRSGVNDSKTIYTDDIGRTHFFTKDAKTTY